MPALISDETISADTHVVTLTGGIDVGVAPLFKDRLVALVEAGKTHFLVDMTKTTFVDSATLGVLISAARRLQDVGGALAIACGDGEIRSLFAITGLDRVFPLLGSRADGLAELATSSHPALMPAPPAA